MLIIPNAYSNEVFTITKYQDIRCCIDVIERDKNGRIKRSQLAKLEFRKQRPCPTGAGLYDPCVGYAIDHVIPLFCGAADLPINMQWLSTEAKKLKDREEMQNYCPDKWANR